MAEEGVVHVWHAKLDRAPGTLRAALSESELARAGAIVHSPRRLEWELARGVLRDVLGRYLELDARAIELRQPAGGPPRLMTQALSPPRSGRLSFALSHSRGALLIVIGNSGGLAVDLERRSDLGPEVRVARRAFGPAAAASLGVLDPPARRREFLRMWTRHEALLKLEGRGIWQRHESRGATGIWVHDLEVPDTREAGAVAAAETPRALRLWEWSPGDGADR